MKQYILPQNLRKILAYLHLYAKNSIKIFTGSKEYIGFVLKNELYTLLHFVASVGDMVCNTFLSLIGQPRICIIDGKTLRIPTNYTKILEQYDCILSCANPPGSISHECLETLDKAIKLGNKCLIIVDGEEDLLALAVVFYPHQIKYIVYGIPHEGVAVIDVEKFATIAINLFSQFKSI